MSAATKDRANFSMKDCHTSGFLVTPYTSTRIYNGTLVMLTTAHASTGCEPATHATAGIVLGVCIRPNPNYATRDEDIVVVNKGQILFNIASASDADIGKTVYVLDDQTVQIAVAGLTNTYAIGTIVAAPSSTTVVVDIADHYTRASLS